MGLHCMSVIDWLWEAKFGAVGNAKLCRAMCIMNLVLANAAMIFQLVYVRDNRSA